VAWALVAGFGAVGALSRYGVERGIGSPGRGDFPVAIFAINIGGAFLLGVIAALVIEREGISEHWRLALSTGFLSAFTTFSTYSLQTVNLLEDGYAGTAAAYALGSLALGLAAAYAGLSLGRSL
jgi:CrcB protein